MADGGPDTRTRLDILLGVPLRNGIGAVAHVERADEEQALDSGTLTGFVHLDGSFIVDSTGTFGAAFSTRASGEDDSVRLLLLDEVLHVLD